MRKAILITVVLGFFSATSMAADINTDHLMFPEDVNEAVRLAQEGNQLEIDGVRTANDYNSDEAWVGATKVEPKDNADEVKQLNRRFVEDK